MDNFFDYIVILFFVVTAIASFIKSKKKKEQEKQQQASSPEVQRIPTQRTETEPVKSEKQTVIDPFEETELFGGGKQKEQAYQQEKQSYKFQDFKSEVDKYFEEALMKSQEAEKVTQSSEEGPVRRSDLYEAGSSISQPQPLPKPPPDSIPHSSFKKSAIVDIHTQQGIISNKRAHDIRKRIRNTYELRDLIVISEILGKPKALRK